jgi:hypothetical protein
MRGAGAALVLAVALPLLGCSRPAPPPGALGPPEVKGRVEDSGGKALARMGVVFHAQDEANKNYRLRCTTQKDGSFVGRCPPGHYKVTLAALPQGDGAPLKKDAPPPKPPPLPAEIPPAYGSVEETPWEVEVPAGGKSGVVLVVK